MNGRRRPASLLTSAPSRSLCLSTLSHTGREEDPISRRLWCLPPPPIPNTQTHTQEKPHERMGKEFKSRSIRGKKQNHTEKRNHALENSRTFEYRRNWSHALCWFAIECSHRCECEVESSRLHGNNHTHKTQHKQHDTKDHRPWCPSRVSNWTPLLQSV